MLTDAHWMRLEPLVEACRPKGKTAPKDLRRTISAIVWRHQNGAKWRAIPADLGPWRLKEWRAIATRYEKTAQSFMGVLCLAAALDWLKT